MDESGELPGFPSYQEVWGKEERHDLLPPRNVQVYYEGDRGNIPYIVGLDRDELVSFLKQEGVRDGKSLKIVFNYGQRPENYNFNELKKPKDALKRGVSIGNHRDLGNVIRLQINLGKLYNTAALFSPKSEEQLERRFHAMVAEVLSHEIGHARQPASELKGTRALDTTLAMVGGAFVLIDAGRRTLLPSLGLLEPAALLGEFQAAERLSRAYYNRTKQERFAREYSSSAAKKWSEILRTVKVSQRRLDETYLWGIMKKSFKKGRG